MAQFKPTDITGITYDFTEIPKVGGGDEERCSGKGVIPEPSDAEIDEFLANNARAEKVETMAQIREIWTAAIVKLGVPEEHLAELPMAGFSAFRDWLADELLPSGVRSALAR